LWVCGASPTVNEDARREGPIVFAAKLGMDSGIFLHPTRPSVRTRSGQMDPAR
jgi:hypothetical protein